MSPFRILLIDDHAMFRAGLSMVLRAGLTGVEVLEAGSLEEAMGGAPPAPDVALLDIQLQGLNGLEGIALLRRQWPQLPLIMLSSHTEPETVRLALARGATAFVSKAESAERILALIEQVLRKEPLDAALPPGGGAPHAEARLTPRQCEVLDLLCQGLSNKLIGRRLGLSENTVRGHVQAVLALLQVASRAEAAYVARQRGLIG